MQLCRNGGLGLSPELLLAGEFLLLCLMLNCSGGEQEGTDLLGSLESLSVGVTDNVVIATLQSVA